MTMPVLAIQQNNGAALQEFFRAVLLDSENKVPSEALRIVGALSAGAVIESGDNANGNYVRFADGTQVCWIFGLYQQNVPAAVTYPAAFVSSPAIAFASGTNVGTSAGNNTVFYFISNSATGFSYKTEHNNTVITGAGLVYIAIGKWK